MDQALAHSAQQPRWFCEVQHVPALVSLVEAGVGIGVVPQLAMPKGRHAALVSKPLLEPAVSRDIGLIHRRGRQLSPAAQLLYDMLMKTRRTV